MTDERSSEYPVLAIRSDVVLPGVLIPIEVGRPMSVRAVDAAAKDDNMILVVPQRDPQDVDPEVEDLHEIGVLGEITQVIKHAPRRYSVMMRFIERMRVDYFTATEPYLVASVEPFVTELPDDETELEALAAELRTDLAAVIANTADDVESATENVMNLEDLDELVDLAAAHIELSRDQAMALLLEPNLLARMTLVCDDVRRMHDVLRMKVDISEKLSEGQREKVLRDRMKSIKAELGEADAGDDLDEYHERIADSNMAGEALAAAKRQLRRMRDMNSSSPEYNVSRTYVETLLDIPWGIFTDDTLDVPAARAILDADHSGLEKVKKRILEFIAVRKLAPDKQGPILCLVGPPGVGKTSLGRSISSALSRKYVRAALGGVRDESEIRGHRRTYIGALPGRIASSLKKAESMNPVFILDEIDKLGSGHRGDPASALLEVLDPEQNCEFTDHYLEVPLDLSHVMFIATANQLGTIPPALLDRMEVIHVPGYTAEEKKTIARDHLLAKQMVEHGLDKDALDISDEVLTELITHYTREAGVRNLEREIAAVCRAAAVAVASGRPAGEITIDDLQGILGPPKFFHEVADRKPEVGVTTGLAWTPVGGDILFIEVREMPGKGNLKLTGQVGDVMRESAMTAMSWVRANAEALGIDAERIASNDVHMHVPSGAVKKDGPSAGLALATTLVSLWTDRPVNNQVAMTGEITLRGRALQVGGIKEKVLAAHRAGIKTVVLPERNEKDTIDIPEHVLEEMDLRFVGKARDAVEIALAPPKGATEGDIPPPAIPPASSGSSDDTGQPSFSS
jgi:ATP-dependent Lon protease